MYRSAVDALQDLIRTKSDGSKVSCRVSRISRQNTRLINGIEYCSVQVSCTDGVQYGLEAYGQEALDLHREASQAKRPEGMIPTMLLH
jgi:hypothetical protein